jgi:pimeloyl-ACP methyl ester carboxylesterase
MAGRGCDDARAMGIVSEERVVIAGVETFWRRAEPDSGSPPPLFIHGVPTNSDIWLPLLEKAGGLALDLPGFGRSGKPADFDYSIGGYERFLDASLEHTALDRFSLVVHDWGGALGLALAQRLHERVHRLVVFNSVPLLPGYRWHRIARVWRTPVAGEMAMGFTTRMTLKWALREATPAAGSMPEDFIDSIYDHFDHGTQRAILRLYRSAPPDVLERWGLGLRAIAAPALVLWATEDPYIPASFGRAYADALGGEAALELVEGAGHWSWRDRPELVDRAAEFLR